MTLADPNPVLITLGFIVALITILLAVMYVREVNTNGLAAQNEK